jgi:hypothetical protein
MSFTVGGSGVAVYPPGATFGPRRLEDFEFVWLLQGTAEWRYDQGSIALGPSSLLLGRPGMTDSFLWDRNRPTRHGYLHSGWTGGRRPCPILPAGRRCGRCPTTIRSDPCCVTCSTSSKTEPAAIRGSSRRCSGCC